jgi:hypothetical protein
MTKRFDVLKKWLPWLIDTPLVFSTNPPNETFSLKNFSHSSPRMEPAQARLEKKATSTTPAIAKKILPYFVVIRSSTDGLPICIFAFGS